MNHLEEHIIKAISTEIKINDRSMDTKDRRRDTNRKRENGRETMNMNQEKEKEQENKCERQKNAEVTRSIGKRREDWKGSVGECVQKRE